MSTRIIAPVAAALLATVNATAGTPTIIYTSLGPDISATDLSSDGSVIVGNVYFDGTYETARWTESSGMWTRLGRATQPIIGTGAGTPDVSYDGTKVSATIINEAGTTATWGLWTEGSGWEDVLPPTLPTGIILDNYYGSAWGLSGDGSTITGFIWESGPGSAQPSTWSQTTGPVALDEIEGRSARVNCANIDGSVTGGWHERSDGVWQPTAWRNGQRFLLNDTVGFTNGVEGMSDDGSILVGQTWDSEISTPVAARWDWNGTSYDEQVLGYLPGTGLTIGSVTAFGVSNDGNVIVGRNAFVNNGPFSSETGFIWTPEGGMQDIEDIMNANGIFLPPNTRVAGLFGLTPDGTKAIGILFNSQTFNVESFLIEFVPDCPGDANADGLVDISDLNLVLGNFGTAGPAGDVNGDNAVDITDLNLVLGNFGQGC